MEHLSKRGWLGRRISRRLITLAGVTVALPIPPASGAEPLARGPLPSLSFEELSQIQVTTLPDAFRYVPGMDVAMINSSQWGVSGRGFCGQYANQLLVMIDGCSVYNSAFGGVLWNGQDEEHWELAVVGQNLLDSSHYEYPRGLSSYQSEAPCSVYATVTWKY